MSSNSGPSDSLAKAAPSDSVSKTLPAADGTAASAPVLITLVALDSQRAWRVDGGSCSTGGAILETTANGGRTWLEGNPHVRGVVRVVSDERRVWFVGGLTSRCVAELRITGDGGLWERLDYEKRAWFRDSENPQAVWAPGPSASLPCGKRAVLDLAVLPPASARVLCDDGVVRSTTNTGSSWTDSGRAPGAVALAVGSANPAQTFVARVGIPRCAGVQILRVGQSSATSCVPTTVPEEPGHIALSVFKGGGWLAVGDKTMRSTDELVTWSTS